MVWVKTFCGCVSTRKGSIVIATIALALAIPSLLLLGIDLRSYLAYAHSNGFDGSQLRTYKAIMITAISLLATYAISSFILMIAAEKNLRTMHLPWLLLHPLITGVVMALLTYVAWLIGYDYSMSAARRIYTVLLVFSIFISFWIMIYLWVVVMSNYQRLESVPDSYATPLIQTDEWHHLGDGWQRRQDQYRYDDGNGSRFGVGAVIGMTLLSTEIRRIAKPVADGTTRENAGSGPVSPQRGTGFTSERGMSSSGGMEFIMSKIYKGIIITTLVLTILHALSSFVLILAAEINLRCLYWPWLVLHPLLMMALMVLLGYSYYAAPFDGYPLVFVIVIFTLFYLVVVKNYVRLGRTKTDDAESLLEDTERPRRHHQRMRTARGKRPWDAMLPAGRSSTPPPEYSD
ncbi:unnamed protein product [Darwinula stevensoni]|uniref:Uncharacterized protein n=1 Tax=Darwinula stevensoni TaxID=69355 RepID=A0A7R8XCL7_9CRUS|nr:unnamed protein product [Darwinula stevensoni]CAG0892101.1 unnamed protein product [Darwinula stevensoni]